MRIGKILAIKQNKQFKVKVKIIREYEKEA